ncbi:glycine cleavage system aminomethyltransferase GcvT [uncultured Desulfuromusa sp.]|uniref:glycine cleavage system aminomethyltransferase GcvT n=1 Tax=uncultured Desulfuromusa sp. TaxID=219183 RepID=UPI002AA78B21|nr:glycine cleavage system aminomethyltransferase GcvT [uncultured Desulfuromusa sp.]
MKATPLNQIHRQLGARMVDFGGWDMPVQYAGVIAEHLAVRSAAGLFDVSHMGEIEVSGPQAFDFLQYTMTNDVSILVDGQVQYTAMCYETGGVVDDLTLYRFAADHYLLCVNASNSDKDFAWLQDVQKKSGFNDLSLVNRSSEYAQLALQGPVAAEILSTLTTVNLEEIKFYHFAEGEVAGISTVVSRTGYTGEDGFELYCPATDGVQLWQELMDAGQSSGLQPIGLGARDTLRLEKAYALYGHEITAEIMPLEARLAWITKLKKGNFVGRDAMIKAKEDGLLRKQIALTLTASGVPREGYPVFCNDEEVGFVTSGTMSPSLKKGIALALVSAAVADSDQPLKIGIRKKQILAERTVLPFVK